MKDFDIGRKARQRTEEERSFVLKGETFVAKNGVHPSALAAYDSIEEGSAIGEVLAVVDDLILSMVEERDDTAGRYLAIRSDKNDPITVEDLLDVVKWLIELQTGRPTGQPGDSSPGQSSTETSSMVASS